jgi:hypothetical protein
MNMMLGKYLTRLDWPAGRSDLFRRVRPVATGRRRLAAGRRPSTRVFLPAEIDDLQSAHELVGLGLAERGEEPALRLHARLLSLT